MYLERQLTRRAGERLAVARAGGANFDVRVAGVDPSPAPVAARPDRGTDRMTLADVDALAIRTRIPSSSSALGFDTTSHPSWTPDCTSIVPPKSRPIVTGTKRIVATCPGCDGSTMTTCVPLDRTTRAVDGRINDGAAS